MMGIFDDLQGLADFVSQLEVLHEEGRGHIAAGREILLMPGLSPEQRQEIEDMCSATEQRMTTDLPEMAAMMRHRLHAIVQVLGGE